MNHVIRQAGVIAFLRNSSTVQLCVSFKPRKGSWKIPKGTVESGDTLPQTALNEALEEAGIYGQLVGDPIGTYDYKKRGNIYRVVIYLMQVTGKDDDWEEKAIRERHWLSPKTALHCLRGHPVYPLVERATEILASQERVRDAGQTPAGLGPAVPGPLSLAYDRQ